MNEKIRVGFVGLGQRSASYGMTDGSIGLIGNILNNCDAIITALSDIKIERIDFAVKRVMDKGFNKPFTSIDYNDLLDKSIVDVIIVSTNWAMHVEVAIKCMEKGIPVAIEVGGTHNLDDLWKLVDVYEKTNTPFMFLENCCYNIDEILVTSLVRNNKLGEISYVEGGYCHDLRSEIIDVAMERGHYRFEEYKNYNCENYPTHELGPIVKLLGITRGNKFTKLVSMSSKSIGLKEYLKNSLKYSYLDKINFKQGDVVNTLIECENGIVVRLKLDTTLPRLYDRGLTVGGTKGFYSQTTKSVIIDGEYNHETTSYKDAFFNQDKYYDYLSSDWKNITEEEKRAGHGGMDYIMLKHFINAVKNNKDMPIDVYEAAAMMSITALSEESIKKGSIPVDVPDFTRGKYKIRKIVDVVELPKI